MANGDKPPTNQVKVVVDAHYNDFKGHQSVFIECSSEADAENKFDKVVAFARSL